MTYDDRPLTAQRLQQARENAKLRTAKEAAERFGWNLHSYHQHENGTRGIGRAAGKYAKAFKVSEAWLLTGEGAGPGDSVSSIDRRLADIRLERPDIAEILHQSIEELIDTSMKVSGTYEKAAQKKP